MKNLNTKPGINFTQDEEGNLVFGAHLDTFINHFRPKANRNGWINLKVVKLDEPIGKFTHKFENVTRKPAA